jgi:hypothetical protein
MPHMTDTRGSRITALRFERTSRSRCYNPDPVIAPAGAIGTAPCLADCVARVYRMKWVRSWPLRKSRNCRLCAVHSLNVTRAAAVPKAYPSAESLDSVVTDAGLEYSEQPAPLHAATWN